MSGADRLLSSLEAQETIDLVAQLVRIPSVNWGPAGEQGGGEYETRCAAFVEDYFRQLGLDTCGCTVAAIGRVADLLVVAGAEFHRVVNS